MNPKIFWSYLVVVLLSLGLLLWLLVISISPVQKKGLPQTAVEGKKIWQQKNCVECHALLGNGGYHAVDLTDVTVRHQREYLLNYLQNSPLLPAARKRKHPSLTPAQAEAVVDYLSKVKSFPGRDWPPEPLRSKSERPGRE